MVGTTWRLSAFMWLIILWGGWAEIVRIQMAVGGLEHGERFLRILWLPLSRIKVNVHH